jgi:hypothetical protein
MVQDDHDVEQAEGGGGNDEHVDGGDAIHVVPQEAAPGGGRRAGAPRHVLGDGRLADADPELKEFAMDAGGAPERIGPTHLADQIADLVSYRRPAAVMAPGPPPPVAAETLAMPLDDGCRLHQGHRVQAAWPEPIKPNPKQPIAGEEAGSAGALAPQDHQLMPGGDNLKFQGGAATKAEGKQGKNGRSDHKRAGDDIGVEPITLCFVSVTHFATGTIIEKYLVRS